MSAVKTETMLLVGGVVVVGVLAYTLLPKAAKAVGGIVSGNNALTQGATNANGTPQTAYQGAGIPGTLGAATNAASGGWLSTFGDWIGGGLYDSTHTDPLAGPVNPAPPSTAAALDKYQQGGNAASGSGSYDMFTDPEGFGAAWGG